jgi:peptidoglycan/LPS O-acetylase OafA/YrhL
VGILGGVFFCVTCLLATYLAAALLFRVAEKPSIELGYAGSEKLARIFARAGRRRGGRETQG